MAIHSPALDPSQPTGLLLDGAFDQRNDDLAVTNPYTGDTIATVAVGGEDDVAAAVAGAVRHLPPPPSGERAQVLERAARLAPERADVRIWLAGGYRLASHLIPSLGVVVIDSFETAGQRETSRALVIRAAR